MSDSATVTIERIAAGGDGVARHDGMVVFVPRAVPGDTVRVSLARQRTFARGRVLEVLTASPDREPPPCPHYDGDRCGGCQLQGLRYGAQLAIKGELIRDALVRIGRQQVEEVTVTPSASPWGYRNSLTLALRRDRMRPSGWMAGMHVAGDPTTVFELRTCLIAMPEVMEGWHQVMEAASNLPRAAALRVTLRRLQSGGLALTVEGATQWKQSAIDALVAAVPSLHAIWWIREDEVRTLRHDRRTVQEAGASFAQVNPAVAAALRDAVVAQVEALSPDAVVDAYAGSGALSVRVLREGRRVTAIELDPEASAVAGAALHADPLARVLTGRVEHLLPHGLPASVVVLNPPRAGVDAAVPPLIAAATSGVQRVVYVSCDPATLARDITRFGPGWKVTDVQAFDMFPQTSHVETVCTIDREPA
ncbi:MAG TPA: class I SAM-dependent RNA methyltransferase [Gemmatimonadaceae bacterium]|nr:class I SAM-dependent RNA methyltransferase [Gemmatimonadaceae bacterium]